MCSAQHFTTHASPWQLLVVCPRGERLEKVRGLTQGWSHPVQIQWTADAGEALRRSRDALLVLAILDARLDRASGYTLSRDLAQHRADMAVLSFDDPATLRSNSRPSTWFWTELPHAVNWWMQRHLQPRPAVTYQ